MTTVVSSTLRVDQRAGLPMVERIVEFLATSRELLGLPGEQRLPLDQGYVRRPPGRR